MRICSLYENERITEPLCITHNQAARISFAASPKLSANFFREIRETKNESKRIVSSKKSKPVTGNGECCPLEPILQTTLWTATHFRSLLCFAFSPSSPSIPSTLCSVFNQLSFYSCEAFLLHVVRRWAVADHFSLLWTRACGAQIVIPEVMWLTEKILKLWKAFRLTN